MEGPGQARISARRRRGERAGEEVEPRGVVW